MVEKTNGADDRLGRSYASWTVYDDDATYTCAVAFSACPVLTRGVKCNLGQLSALWDHVDVCILCTESSGVVTGVVSEVFEGRNIRGGVGISETGAHVFQRAD